MILSANTRELRSNDLVPESHYMAQPLLALVEQHWNEIKDPADEIEVSELCEKLGFFFLPEHPKILTLVSSESVLVTDSSLPSHQKRPRRSPSVTRSRELG